MEQISSSDSPIVPVHKTDKAAKASKAALNSGAFDALFAGMAVKAKGGEAPIKADTPMTQDGLSPDMLAHLSAPKIKAKLLAPKEDAPNPKTKEPTEQEVAPLDTLPIAAIPEARQMPDGLAVEATLDVTAIQTAEPVSEFEPKGEAVSTEVGETFEPAAAAAPQSATIGARPTPDDIAKAVDPIVHDEPTERALQPSEPIAARTVAEVPSKSAQQTAPIKTMVVSELRSARTQKIDAPTPMRMEKVAANVTEATPTQAKPKARPSESFGPTPARVSPVFQQAIVQPQLVIPQETKPTAPLPSDAGANLLATPSGATVQTFDADAPNANTQDLPVLDTRAEDWLETLSEMVDGVYQDGTQEIELALTPETLGDLRIRIEMDDGAAQVTIVTDNAEASKLFNQNETQLADLLQQRGLSLGQHAAGERREQQQQGQTANNQAKADKVPEQSTVNQPETRHDGRLNIVA